jgi:hypothetical protein
VVVNVQDGDFPLSTQPLSSDSGVVQEAEPAADFPAGVMAWRAAQGESGAMTLRDRLRAGKSALRCSQGSGVRSQR